MQKLSIACALAGLSEMGEDFARLLEQRAFDVGISRWVSTHSTPTHATNSL